MKSCPGTRSAFVNRGKSTQMRQHNNLTGRRQYREQRFLTERQFLTLATCFNNDRMTKRETTSLLMECPEPKSSGMDGGACHEMYGTFDSRTQAYSASA